MNFAPFRNESDAITLVAIYGTLAITRDRAGLEAAKALKEAAGRIVKELEDGHDLPAMAG